MSPHLLHLRNHKEGLSCTCTCTIEACTVHISACRRVRRRLVDMLARMGGSSRTKKSATLKGGHVPPSPPPKSATGHRNVMRSSNPKEIQILQVRLSKTNAKLINSIVCQRCDCVVRIIDCQLFSFTHLTHAMFR